MAKSRIKILIPMLALCLFAVSAYGQAALQLGSNPTKVRAEGITEQVGLITLFNTSAAAQIIPGGTTVIVQFDGTITNGTGTAGAGNMIGVGGPAPTGNVYTSGTGSSTMAGNVVAGTGTASSTGTTLTITIPANYGNDGTGACAAGTAPATATTLCLVPGGSLNIQGIRLNVSPFAGVTPPEIKATLTTVPPNALTFPVGGNQTVVGRVQVTIAAGTPGLASIAQCLIPTTPSAANQTTFFTAAGAINVGGGAGAAGYTAAQAATIPVLESPNFPTALNAANSNAPGAPNPWDEAGLTPAALQGLAPVPTRGVQLIFAFTAIPTGFSIIVPQTWGAVTSTSTLTMTLQGLGAAAVAGAATVVPSSGGLANVTYEVTATGATSPTIQDTVTLTVAFTGPAGTAPQSLGAVNIQIGPQSASTGFITTAGSQLRFVQGQTGLNYAIIGNITGCQTNLLFPFVSNQLGYNTGIAIANTGKDAGTTVGEAGGITMYFFGCTASATGCNPALPASGTTGIALGTTFILSNTAGGHVATAGLVAPGETTALGLSQIAPGFQGYIIARCGFRYAHGIANIFDRFGAGAPEVGFSYLALVLNGSTTGRTGTANVIGAGPDAVGLGQ